LRPLCSVCHVPLMQRDPRLFLPSLLFCGPLSLMLLLLTVYPDGNFLYLIGCDSGIQSPNSTPSLEPSASLSFHQCPCPSPWSSSLCFSTWQLQHPTEHHGASHCAHFPECFAVPSTWAHEHL
uniref:Uncharacterized protein n=1 Tax=Mus spicilegus TaxID=10103 RepID=A0A8C6GM01_MUSSI